jgi:hypothetical protein
LYFAYRDKKVVGVFVRFRAPLGLIQAAKCKLAGKTIAMVNPWFEIDLHLSLLSVGPSCAWT